MSSTPVGFHVPAREAGHRGSVSSHMVAKDRHVERECVLFIGTRFSNLYTAVDTPGAATRDGMGTLI
jgi:hypothetical protein